MLILLPLRNCINKDIKRVIIRQLLIIVYGHFFHLFVVFRVFVSLNSLYSVIATRVFYILCTYYLLSKNELNQNKHQIIWNILTQYNTAISLKFVFYYVEWHDLSEILKNLFAYKYFINKINKIILNNWKTQSFRLIF